MHLLAEPHRQNGQPVPAGDAAPPAPVAGATAPAPRPGSLLARLWRWLRARLRRRRGETAGECYWRERCEAAERALADELRAQRHRQLDWDLERRKLQADADVSRHEARLLSDMNEANHKRVERFIERDARFIAGHGER